MDNVRILNLNGDHISLLEWQQKYGLPVGSTKIGKHFSYTEDRFQRDLAQYKVLIVCEPLIMVLDEYRELKGQPVDISSFNRDAKKQAALRNQDNAVKHLRAVVSEHEYKIAADVDCTDELDLLASVPLMRQAAKNKNIKIRIGFQDYLDQMHVEKKKWNGLSEPRKPFTFPWTFIHVGCGPEYFAPGKAWNHIQHPEVWERPIEW